MKKLIKLIYLIFTALIAYGAAEGAFATSNVIEGVQEAYYGYTNQKDKESINPGKILLGENEYIILDNMSASMRTQALQIADYTKTKAEAEKATKTLSNINKTSNQSKTAFIANEKIKQYSVDPNFDLDHVIGGDVSKNGKRVTGGHSLVKGDVRISEIIDEADINGVYKAKVEIYNPKTQKWELKKADTTMFSKDWDDDRIKEEIKSAWGSHDFKVTITNNGKEWSGTADSGIKIKGYINPTKSTAFPEYEGDK